METIKPSFYLLANTFLLSASLKQIFETNNLNVIRHIIWLVVTAYYYVQPHTIEAIGRNMLTGLFVSFSTHLTLMSIYHVLIFYDNKMATYLVVSVSISVLLTILDFSQNLIIL